MGLSDWFGHKETPKASTPKAKPAKPAKPAKSTKAGKHSANTGLSNNSPSRHGKGFSAKHGK